MAHEHNHSHGVSNSTAGRLIATIILNFITSAAEIAGGIISGSLSLISDALHNLSDGAAVIISLIALKLTKKDISFKHTFGLKRAEILAALINASVLIGIYLFLLYEAVKRFYTPVKIEPEMMTIVAVIGLFMNIAGTLLLKKDSAESINIRSSYLHLLSDTVASVAVIAGGAAIYFWQAYWVDPVLTILIGAYIIKESYSILMEAVHILMEGAPLNVSITEIQKEVEQFKEVANIHHVHLWSIGDNDIHLEAHVDIEDMTISQSGELRDKIEKALGEKFGINHITLQFECNTCSENGLLGMH